MSDSTARATASARIAREARFAPKMSREMGRWARELSANLASRAPRLYSFCKSIKRALCSACVCVCVRARVRVFGLLVCVQAGKFSL